MNVMAKATPFVVLAVLVVLASSCKSSEFVYCKPATFANCTVAKCALNTEGTAYVCDCFVDNRYSATAKSSTCKEGSDYELQSRFHPIESYQLCTTGQPDNKLWAWCLGMPCKTQPNSTSAQCECTFIPAGVPSIPYIVVTPTYVSTACEPNPGGIVWSSATPDDVQSITEFLQESHPELGIKLPVVVLNPKQ